MMLRNLDVRLKQSLQSMIEGLIEDQDFPDTVDRMADAVLNEDSWLNELTRIRAEYRNLAEPELMSLLPELILTCDEVRQYVIDLHLDDQLTAELLYQLSRYRKYMGFDRILRALTSNGKK